MAPLDRAANRMSVTGYYAGPVSRAAAAAVDVGIIIGAYTVSLAGLRLLLDAFFNVNLDDDNHAGLLAISALSLWAFFYVFVSIAVAGQTVGKSLVGLRVVRADGATVTVVAAFIRTIVLPISTLLFGLGLVGIVIGRHHRALHDVAAGTAVVYDWGDRSAQLPGPLSDFLSRSGS